MVILKCCQGYATLCRVLTNLWLVAAVLFSALTLTSCEFVKRGYGSFGLFNYGMYDECVESYQDGFTHGWLHTWAAVCGVLAPIFGGIVVLFMLLDCCCKVCCSSLMQSLLLSGAELSQAFTFLFYASDACISRPQNSDFEDIIWDGCTIGQGSIYSLISFGCYFIGGCFLCCSPKPDPLSCHKDGDAAEKSHVKEEKQEEKQEQAVFQDEENAAAADPQSPPAEVKPQVY
mmetsp:Transcript_25548/g.44671  ORF Transcript_25548/g.44671 Transcript_25548/m.44671 type:complete len:231 (-) Transcript_25548:232-924(-)